MLNSCFWCKYTQILKAIHNEKWCVVSWMMVVSDANIHKFWKQFTTAYRHKSCRLALFLMQIYTNFESNSQPVAFSAIALTGCFWCKYTQILKAIHNEPRLIYIKQIVVSDANIHKFWKQFTTSCIYTSSKVSLFLMQIYTNFESNSQLTQAQNMVRMGCFWCKYTQILKAIHNDRLEYNRQVYVVSDANIHKFWKQFTTQPKEK